MESTLIKLQAIGVQTQKLIVREWVAVPYRTDSKSLQHFEPKKITDGNHFVEPKCSSETRGASVQTAVCD